MGCPLLAWRFSGLYAFYYLIIIIAALWYGKKALWIALFFGGLYVMVTYMDLGTIPPDAPFRAAMFCILAFIIGTIVETMNSYRSQLESQNHELHEINSRLDSSQKAFETANKKLHLLSSVTRHDIKNQLMGLLMFLELVREKTTDPETLGFIGKEEVAVQNIRSQIEFTKNYEDIGVNAPQWQDVGIRVKALQSLTPGVEISVAPAGEGLYPAHRQLPPAWRTGEAHLALQHAVRDGRYRHRVR